MFLVPPTFTVCSNVVSILYVLTFKENQVNLSPCQRNESLCVVWPNVNHLFHCHRRAAGGGFLSLLLAVLMIAVVAEMRSRWQSRAAAAACPDLFSRQAVRKAARILFPLAFVRDIQLDLSSLASLPVGSCWRAPAISGTGCFLPSEMSGTGGARTRIRGRRTSLPLWRLFFFLFFYYTKQSNKQQKNSFSGVSYAEKVPCRFVRCRQFLLPSFFAALNGTKQTQKLPRLVSSSLTGWVAAVNTESHWSTLVVCSFARGRWEFPDTQEICSNNRTT